MTDAAHQGKWFKSRRSEQANACVEIKFTTHAVGIRDSKDGGAGSELWFPGAAWDAFIASGIWRR